MAWIHGDLELYGSIKIGIAGQTFTTVQDFKDVDISNGWNFTIDKAYSCILKAGDAKVTLIADNFYDYDSASGNDLFSDNSVDFKWKAEAGSGEITLNGDKDTGTNVKLHLAYSVSIAQSKE
jgi:hypothetical protein